MYTEYLLPKIWKIKDVLFKIPSKSIGNFISIGGVEIEEKIKVLIKTAIAGPKKLSAIPVIIWSDFKKIVKTACKIARTSPASPPAKIENNGSFVKYATVAPENAPIVIIPSSPILIIPLFSLIRPPRPAKIKVWEFIKVSLIKNIIIFDTLNTF